MKIFFYIVFYVSILSACSESKVEYTFHYSTFPEEASLISDVVQLDTALFRYPFRIAVRDSVGLVMDLHNANYYFHAFTYPEWKHIVSFGKRGEAPEEMLAADSFHFFSLDSIWMLDANRMEISRWQIIPHLCTAERVERISLDKELVRTLDFYPADSCFFASDYLGSYRYHQLDKTGRMIRSEGQIPVRDTYKEAVRPALAQAWRSFMDYNPQKGILAMATQLGEVLQVYNLKEKTGFSTCGPQGAPQFRIREGEGIPTGIMGFSDIQITDHYIYTVFHDRAFKEIIDSFQKGEFMEDGGRYIYIFDLNGSPVRKYTLDRAVYGIYVDEKNGIILATDVNSDEPIVRFNFSV